MAVSLTTSSICHLCAHCGGTKGATNGKILKIFHGSDDDSGIRSGGGGSTFWNCWAPGVTGTLWLAGAFSRSLFPPSGGPPCDSSPLRDAAPSFFLFLAVLAFLQSIPLPNCYFKKQNFISIRPTPKKKKKKKSTWAGMGSMCTSSTPPAQHSCCSGMHCGTRHVGSQSSPVIKYQSR